MEAPEIGLSHPFTLFWPSHTHHDRLARDKREVLQRSRIIVAVEKAVQVFRVAILRRPRLVCVGNPPTASTGEQVRLELVALHGSTRYMGQKFGSCYDSSQNTRSRNRSPVILVEDVIELVCKDLQGSTAQTHEVCELVFSLTVVHDPAVPRHHAPGTVCSAKGGLTGFHRQRKPTPQPLLTVILSVVKLERVDCAVEVRVDLLVQATDSPQQVPRVVLSVLPALKSRR